MLQFPYEFLETRWGLSIGCSASLGVPEATLSMMKKQPGESTWTTFVPQVQKPAELRRNESNDSSHTCLKNVVYEFDTDLVGWNMTEFRCGINEGTENEILSEIGVFEVVPGRYHCLVLIQLVNTKSNKISFAFSKVSKHHCHPARQTIKPIAQLN